MRYTFALLSCLLAFTTAAAQQQRADTVYTPSVYALPAIEVTALRLPQASLTAPVQLSIVNAEAIQASNSQTLAQLLDRAGSPFIRSYGNGLASLSFRGTGSSQSLILLDGVPLTDPQLGQIDLSLIPTQIIDHLHIQHGQGASLYGSQSIGSVINLATKKTSRPFVLETTAGAGPFGERQGSASIGVSNGTWQSLASVAHSTEQGDFPFLNPSLFPPANSRREGSDRLTTSVFASASRSTARTVSSITGWYNRAVRGLPGTSTTTPKDERQWDRGNRFIARHTLMLSSGLIAFTGASQSGALRYRNPQLDLDNTGHTWAHSFDTELTLNRPLGRIQTGLSGSLYRARHPNLSDNARESRLAAFASTTHGISRFSFFPALRFDAFMPSTSRHLTALSPSLGVNVQPVANTPLHVKANVGRGFRAPTFNDRFWQPGGNPNLQPEHNWQYELGFVYAQTFERIAWQFEASGFYNRIKNQITWLPSVQNGSIWQPENIGTTKILGTDLTMRGIWRLTKQWGFDVQASYTLADARDISDPGATAFDHPLRYTPRHVAKTRAGIVHQQGSLQIQLDAALRHVSRRYITTDGSQFLAPYTTMDVHLRIAQTFRKTRITAGAFLENTTDQRFEIIKGYPVPPRTLRFQLSFRFGAE